MTRCLCSSLLFACSVWGVAACGGDDDAPLDLTVTLQVMNDGTDANCLALDGASITVEAATVVDSQIAIAACVLGVVRIGDQLWWLSGPDFDVGLDTSQFDDDPVRHSVSTTEDVVNVEQATFVVFALDEFEDFEQTIGRLFAGTLDVTRVDAASGEVDVTVTE